MVYTYVNDTSCIKISFNIEATQYYFFSLVCSDYKAITVLYNHRFFLGGYYLHLIKNIIIFKRFKCAQLSKTYSTMLLAILT